MDERTQPGSPKLRQQVSRQRWRLLRRIQRWSEWPLIVLAAVWLLLTIVDLTRGLNPLLTGLNAVIWVVFAADFLLGFLLAPRKRIYFKHNWLTLVALIIPAIRVLRVLRAVRALRGVRLVRIITSINRGMGALGHSMQRRGLGYVSALTLIVLFAGAAGMYAFESGVGPRGLHSYGEAVWWTAMLLTTIGSEYWPRTSEGRALTFLLSMYGLGILGYVAASLASFFIGRDADSPRGEVAGENALRELRREIAQLRAELSQARK